MGVPSFNPKEYWETRFSKGVGLDTTGFIGMGSAYNDVLYQCYAAALKLLLRKHSLTLRSDTCVTDAGAGSGFIEQFCQHHGVSELLGLDFAAPAVAYLRQRFPTYCFLQQDLTQPIPVDTKPSDITFCLSVLYHIVDVAGFETALSNLARATRSGGYVIIADNFMPMRQPVIEGCHQRHWSKGEFETILAKQGLEPLAYQPIFFSLNAPIRFQHQAIGRFYLECWTWLQKQVAGNERRSKIFAKATLTIDLMLQRIFRWGPSSHYLLCRKTSDHVSA